MRIDIKPLSVNKAWMGKRFKTKEYKKFENDLLYLLPKIDTTDFSDLEITYGFSSKLADIDNPTKMVLDVMQKRYGFNDRDIIKLTLRKALVNKGNEYIDIKINKK